jgi:hypothetical protein
MYASIRKYKNVTDADEAIKRINEEFVPIVSGVPGFIAYYVVGSGEGVVTSVNIFEDKSGVQESNRRAAGFVKNYANLFTTPPEITAGDILILKNK